MAGSSIPAHSHTHADQTVFVIQGELIDEGVSYGPGSFLVAKAGSPHGPHSSSGGCVLLTTYFGTPDGTVNDGPVPETKAIIGGFSIIEVPSREEALVWAARIAKACRCTQEVREIMFDPES